MNEMAEIFHPSQFQEKKGMEFAIYDLFRIHTHELYFFSGTRPRSLAV
jgi:hypothetical protein